MAAVKPLVALGLLALAFAGSALADEPTVHITRADQARAVAALLSLNDFATGWRGGRTAAHTLASPKCPGFDPKESDLVVSGHADAAFTYPIGPVTFQQDVQLLRSDTAVRTDFARTITPGFPRCLARQLEGQKGIVSVDVRRIEFPAVGSVSAAYRAVLTVKAGSHVGRVYEDVVLFGVGRYEYTLTLLATARLVGQLEPFEESMAARLVKRAAKPCC